MSDTPVKIGVVLPLTGAEQLFGSQGLQGAQMAVAEINAAGGVLGGRPLELVIEDEQTDTGLAEKLTEKVITQDGVLAVMGPTSSADRNAMLAICTQHRTPLLYATDYEGGACSRYLFCYSPIPDHYVKPLVPHLMADGGNSFAIIGADYVWPTSIGASFRAEVSARGGTVVSEEYLPPDVGEFDKNLQRIADSGADNVVMMLLGTNGQAFIRQFAARQWKQRPTLTVMAFNENYMQGLTPQECEGIMTGAPFLANLNRPETISFVERQKAMFGPDTIVSYFAESHYGLLMFLRDAIQKAGTDDREQVIDAMGDQTLVIGNGPVTLRAGDHHMILNMVIAQVKDGELTMTDYIGPVAPADQCRGHGPR